MLARAASLPLRRHLLLLLLLLLPPLAPPAPAAPGTGADAAPLPPATTERHALWKQWRRQGMPPADYVVSKFGDAGWVFLGEYHRIRHDVTLVQDLIPALHTRTPVRHLALEFLCRDRTAEADRLITAPRWDRGEAIRFFRSMFVSWPYEEYLGIYEAAWKSNRRHAAKRGAFHLVGLHPCPDYEAIHWGGDEEAVAREQEKWSRYDAIMAEAMEAQLLAPGLPALVFTGIAHSTARFTEYLSGTDEPLPRMGNLLYHAPYRERMFFIALHAPFWDAASGREIYPFDGVLDRMMLRRGRAVGYDVAGTPFAGLVHSRRDDLSITRYRFGELYDGYIQFATPIKEYQGVNCIQDWIVEERDFRQFWRNLPNREAGERFASMPFEEFRAGFCAPRPGDGAQFDWRFRDLPDLTAD